MTTELKEKKETTEPEVTAASHPATKYLREERLPHIWCSGCGLGSAVTSLTNAFDELELPIDDIGIVSGIGCAGRGAGYFETDSYHTTHGRAIPFATGLKLANPKMSVTVFSGDGDLFAIGGNHFIHAARRNLDMTVICVNNYNFGMTGGQFGPTTPQGATATTAPYGNYENPFNLPELASSAGAAYVARWTSVHARRIEGAMEEALEKDGFSFVEILSPCPTGYGRKNDLGEGIDELKSYQERAIIKHGSDPGKAEIERDPNSEIIVGKFVDEERPTLCEVADSYLE
ncbi:2-oxoacid:ferredoxin oxidoreductase subunit beta, partial [Candidatus Bipolaricaulota bacterium]|nr:2-oxoacid:ferredoxin oxidoreductase subunit beta [Candidatus Bipolaricaulota bacterium]